MDSCTTLPDGFYILKNKKTNEASLVKLHSLYSHEDFGNVQRIVFDVWDGGGSLCLTDLSEDSVLVPAKILPHTTPTTTEELFSL